jgi:hypothetical protein
LQRAGQFQLLHKQQIIQVLAALIALSVQITAPVLSLDAHVQLMTVVHRAVVSS